MMTKQKTFLTLAVAFAMSANSAFSQAPAVPVAAPVTPTLWSFLGIPQGMKKVQGALTNRRGERPRLEPKDALKALNDPKNLESSNKAIKKAAELKIQEDLKPQKIKAVKYLASIGCGCYDKGGEVTAALIAASEDCTEDVRLTVMQEIKAAACSKCCSNCGQVCCCNEKMLKKLAEIAYERDDAGCYKEPSARVRQAAAEALKTCVPNSEPPCIAPENSDGNVPEVQPESKPSPERSIEPEKKPSPERRSGDLQEVIDAPKENAEAEYKQQPLEIFNETVQEKLSDLRPGEVSSQSSSRRRMQSEYNSAASQLPSQASVQISSEETGFETDHAFHSQLVSELSELVDNEGVVISYNERDRVAHVHFANRKADLRLGDQIAFMNDPTPENSISGRWQIVFVESGCVRMKAMDDRSARSVTPGQHIKLSLEPVNSSFAPVR